MIRTFVYGSCVSRDTFERLPSGEFQLLHYVARQSLISALSPPPKEPAPSFETPSAFQRRMLTGDWGSSLLPLLRDHAKGTDLLLWDLCDERLGVRQLGSPGPQRTPPMVTRSVDSIRAGVDNRISDAPHIAFGSLRHRLLFLRSLRLLVPALVEMDLLSKIVVLAPAWADRSSSGNQAPSSFGLEPARANRLYEDYYAAIEQVVQVPVLRVPAPDVLADADHPWGVAPFHYVEGVYANLASEICRHASPDNRDR